MTGQTVSHYRILEKLGEGGMGEVFLAEDTKLKRQIALKFLPRQMTADPEAKERFEREAQAAAALNHPNIVTIHEIGEHEGQVFIAMEYVEGQTLKDLISVGADLRVCPDDEMQKKGEHRGSPLPNTHHPIPIAQVIEIATQLASGLAAAHARGIVHRDIKPQNILVDKNNHVKILDFGLAKLKGVSSLTKESSTLGTVHYMSPEQTMGKEVDHRTDIWSLGVVLYELLTGKLPFKGDYEQAVIYSILNEELEPINNLRPDIPGELQAIVSKCLEKEIDVRYQHADDLVADLKRARRDSKPLSASKPQPKIAETLKKMQWRRVAAGVLLAAGVAGFGYLLFRGKEKPLTAARTGGRPSVTVLYFENNSGSKNMDKWRSQFAELLITDLSQSRYLEVVSGERIYSVLRELKLLETKKYSAEDLKEVARLSGAAYVLSGSFITAGKNLLINVSLQEADSGRIISSLRVESHGEEEIFPKIDEITRRIKFDLDLTSQQLARDSDKALAEITTSSPLAYESYSQGRTQHRLNNYRASIELMKKALAVDPEFAMAWRSMAASYENMVCPDDAKRCIAKARELGNRVSERERLLIAGQNYFMSEKTFPQAIEAFQNLLRLYPDSSLGSGRLGELYITLEKWDEAKPLFTSNLMDRDPDISYWACFYLATLHSRKGEFSNALQVLLGYKKRFPDSLNGDVYIVYNLDHLGKYESALSVIDGNLAVDPEKSQIIAQKGDVLFHSGNLSGPETFYQKLLGMKEPFSRIIGMEGLICLYASQGRFEKADTIAKQALSLSTRESQGEWKRYFLEFSAQLDRRNGKSGRALNACEQILAGVRETDDWGWQRSALYTRGLVLAEMGRFEEASRTAVALLAMIRKGMNPKLQRLYDHLQGVIELNRGNHTLAIEFIRKALAQSIVSQSGKSLIQNIVRQNGLYEDYFYYSLGEACYRSGRMSEAAAALEQITLAPTGRSNLDYGPCLLLLGRVYQKMGDIEKSQDNYEKFIHHWETCDTRFRPMVDEAKLAIARLKKSRST